MPAPQILGLTKATPTLPFFKGDGLPYLRQCLIDSNRTDCELSKTTLYFRVAGGRRDDADLQSRWQNTDVEATDRVSSVNYNDLLVAASAQVTPYLNCADQLRKLCYQEIAVSVSQGLINTTDRLFKSTGISFEYQGCKLRSINLDSQQGYYGADQELIPVEDWLLNLVSEGLLSSSRPDVSRVEIALQPRDCGSVSSVICPLLNTPNPKDTPARSTLKSFKTTRDRAAKTISKQLNLVMGFVGLWDFTVGSAVFEKGYFKRVDWSCSKTFG